MLEHLKYIDLTNQWRDDWDLLNRLEDGSLFLLRTPLGKIHVCKLMQGQPHDREVYALRLSDWRRIAVNRVGWGYYMLSNQPVYRAY